MIRRGSMPVLLALVLVACASAASPSPSANLPGATATATDAPSEQATTEPIPSDQLGEFSCELPVVEPASLPQTVNIVDVRIGMHDGYDRVVFEYNEGTPEFTLDRAQPPFVQDGSGLPVQVQGDAFLKLVMRGGTKQTETGGSSYDGPTDFDPGFPRLVDLVETGDFEAQSTWVLGMSGDACVRVMLLSDPDRLVIDVEH